MGIRYPILLRRVNKRHGMGSPWPISAPLPSEQPAARTPLLAGHQLSERCMLTKLGSDNMSVDRCLLSLPRSTQSATVHFVCSASGWWAASNRDTDRSVAPGGRHPGLVTTDYNEHPMSIIHWRASDFESPSKYSVMPANWRCHSFV